MVSKNEKPKISVIIPLYNTENYIEDTLRSIVNQTLKEIEIIIINDGSTDRSLAIVEAVEDCRIRIVSQPNQGPSVSRNNGLELAIGDYVYFMDSDDILASDCLEQCYDRCHRDDLDFVFFNAEIFGDDNHIFAPDYYIRTISQEPIYSGIEAMRALIMKHEFRSSVCINLIKKEYLKSINIKFYQKLLHEDELYIYLLYAQASRVAFIKESFFKRRVRPNSIMSSSIKFRNIECYNIVIKEILKFVEGQSAEAKELTDIFLRRTINAVLYKAHTLPLRDKIRTAALFLPYYIKYVNTKSILILFLK